MSREASFSYFLFILVGLTISKCPEIRKPHPTNCTLFYNCVNLPSGEYVWTPSKCSEGLMFESYLGICVLPSETWTCETNFHEKRNTDELVKSYLDLSSDHLDFSETLDSSYFLDATTDKNINPTTSNSLNKKFPTSETNQDPANQRIDEKPSDENTNEPNNFPNLEKKIIVNNIVLLNYFITNYIIRNSDENKNEKIEKIDTIKNETKYEIASENANSIENTNEKQKMTIYNFNPINRIVNNKSITVKNIFKKDQNNFAVNSPTTENNNPTMKNLCKTTGNIADPNSPSHYYLCYSNNEKTTSLASVRMMCPKNLVFCAEKKICTRQRICRKNLSNKGVNKNNK